MKMTEYEIIQTLSGADELRKTKVGVLLLHELIGSDGTIRVVDELYFEKPELNIFKDGNITRLDFKYEFPDDQDLLQQYMFIEKFYEPQNSTNFTADDLDRIQIQELALSSGLVIPEEEELVLYDHSLTINVISLDPKGKYSLTSLAKPLFYNLVPLRPNEPATVFRMVFNRNDIVIQEETDEDVNENVNATSESTFIE